MCCIINFCSTFSSPWRNILGNVHLLDPKNLTSITIVIVMSCSWFESLLLNYDSFVKVVKYY